MKKNFLFLFSFLFRFFFSLSSLLFFSPTYAWQHEVAIGYGDGKEIEQNYDNRGVVLSGKFYKFPKIDDTLIASIDGTLANINSSTSTDNHLVTAAAALAMRAYFMNPDDHSVRPYLQASFGPALLSQRTLGNRTQGSNFAFQTTFETGMEIGSQAKSIDLNLRLAHYCNAGLFHPNQGINLMPIVSIGYLF